MKSQYFRFAVLFVAVASLTGCTMFTEPFAPPQSFDTDADIQALETVYGTASSITGYYAKGATQNKTTRNEFISGRLALINLQYNRFVRKFAADKAQIDTVLDMLQLGTDLAITVVGGASTKAALGAASAGITGTRTSVDKNFFYEQTVPVLIAAMNAARKKALLPILKGIDADLTAYPFADAVSDLQDYYMAGTFVGGRQAIQKDAGVKEAEADLDIAQFRNTKFQPDTPTGVRIEAWSELSTENNDNLVLWLRENGLGEVGHPAFLTAPVLEAARVKAIKDLKIPPIP